MTQLTAVGMLSRRGIASAGVPQPESGYPFSSPSAGCWQTKVRMRHGVERRAGPRARRGHRSRPQGAQGLTCCRTSALCSLLIVAVRQVRWLELVERQATRMTWRYPQHKITTGTYQDSAQAEITSRSTFSRYVGFPNLIELHPKRLGLVPKRNS